MYGSLYAVVHKMEMKCQRLILAGLNANIGSMFQIRRKKNEQPKKIIIKNYDNK